MRIFVSYARNDLDGGELDRFLDELDRDLKAKLGEKIEILFRDLKDLRLGDRWEGKLEEALKTSSLLLAICSPSYVKSEYCGKEYNVFLERLQEANKLPGPKKKDLRSIFPIVWIVPRQKVPDAIGHFQYVNDTLPMAYAQQGLRQLFRLTRHRDDALEVVSALATSLVEALDTPVPEAIEIKPLDQQANAFNQAKPGMHVPIEMAGGSDLVRVVIVAGRRDELETVRTIVSAYDVHGRLWRPFMPESSRPLAAEVQQIIAQEGLISELWDLSDGLCERIAEAQRRNEIVLLLADPWTLRLPNYAHQLEPYDRCYALNATLLMVWNSKDDETARREADLEGELRAIFRNKMGIVPPGHIFKGVNGQSELIRHLTRALTEAKLRVIGLTPYHRRAEHKELEDRAAGLGIDVTTRAILQGPVGERQ